MTHALEPVVLDGSQSSTPLGRSIDYLPEQEERLSIEQVSSPAFERRFSPSESDTPNFGFTTTAYWFRFQLQSDLPDKRRFLLEIGYPALDRIEVYIDRGGGSFTRHVLGDTFPHGNKLIPHINYVIPIDLNSQQRQRIFLRIQTKGSLQVPLLLWTPQGMLDQEQRRQLFIGVFYGLLLVMIFYNLFLYVSIRDRTYLYYVGFVCSAFFYQSTAYGTANEYFWPALPWFANRAYCFFLYGNILFAHLMAIKMLYMKEEHPRLHIIFSTISAAGGAGMVLTFVLPYNVMVPPVPVLAITGCALALVASVVSMRRGFKPARFYFAAWVAYLLGIIFWGSNKLGLLPVTTLTENTHLIGSALNAVLLSFALADRINVMKEEKDQAQAEALQVQRQAAENLEREVARKTEDLRKRSDELMDAYEQLAEHDRLKSSFFANVSHEVRTPLALILTPLERLLAGESGPLTDQVADRLRSMVGNVQRLLRLINQLLDFSRLESGGLTVTYDQVEPRRFLESILQAFSPFARSKDLQLELRGPDTLPEIWTDPAKLEKVVSNLLSNACKFTEEKGSVVMRLAGDDSEISISVMDTGIGIAEEDLPRIFERFRQVDGSSSRRYEGTGIGLALSKELVEMIGGRIDVKSELGAGSSFTLSLPLGQDHIQEGSITRDVEISMDEGAAVTTTAAALAAEVGIRRQETVKPPEGGDAESTRPLVIVVEDNPDMRQLVTEICQNEYRVIQAPDGKQGLDLIREHRPTLVISDIMMPEMDGHQLLRQIRADTALATTPVILLTAKAGPEMRLEGLESGADDYLTKPFESRELLARARNLVRLQRQEQQLREQAARLQQEVVSQAVALERTRHLARFLPASMVRSVVEGEHPVEVIQQRSQLTVFRLEMRGFDELIEGLDPEDTAALLNSYLSEMIDIAFAHGATVDKLIRDTVTGFFGAPSSEGSERDAIRCAKMALQMWERAEDLCARWRYLHQDELVTPTMVLASGFSTVGNFGTSDRMDYTAMGGPVEEARQILPRVPAGHLLCTQSIWNMIKGEIEGQPHGETFTGLRGKPMHLFRLGRMELATPTMETDATETIDSQYGIKTGMGSSTGPLQPESIFADRYRIIQLLGKGGMGTVYRTWDLKLKTDVALKVLHPELSTDSRTKARLYREVKVARLISHANVARIYDLDEWQGQEFITMAFIEGHTLEQRLRDMGRLPIPLGKDLMLQLCSGLGAAHSVGIVHRDLKPGNIMLDLEGQAIILDFGIARWLTEQTLNDAEGSSVIGTPYYMAPEQWEGKDIRPQADIYSLGVVALEMLAGERPFEARSLPRMALLHTSQPPPDPSTLRPDLPPRLCAIILRCLQKDPRNRFNSVAEIRNMLMGTH